MVNHTQSYFIIAAIAAILLLSGCTLKQSPKDENVFVNYNIAEPAPPIGSGQQTEPPVMANVVKSPILCNDEIIARNVIALLGTEYTLVKSPPAVGQTFQSTNCFLKNGNVSQVTYYVLEQPNKETAVEVLDDEAIQYEQQLFRKSSAQYTIGTKSYLFEQPTNDGSLYRLIFVDGTNSKINVFIKSNVEIDKSVVENLAQALEKSI
ncbi:MAG TPA: hypothetical protein VJH23_01130 [archaeon]|nr:hypothetical protein [archaeon]